MNERTERSSYTLLVIDDEIDTIMRWFIHRLEVKGFRIHPCRFFAEAVAWLQERDVIEKEIDGVILDIMPPLRKEDEEAYCKITRHKPRGPTDAMKAGLTLLPLIRKCLPGVPIFVLTSLLEETAFGRAVYGELKKTLAVRYIQRKPADDKFFELLRDALANPNEEKGET